MVLVALLLVAAQPLVAFEDPEGDGHGPGSYTLPASGDFTEGDFDLRRFAVLVDGDDAVFEVTLGAAVRRPQVTTRSGSSEIPLTSGVYLQNIDIYIDTRQGAVSQACIPGRRVEFAEGQGWTRAVVLTPQPGPSRSIVSDAFGAAAAHVIFVDPVQSRGRTLIARVPVVALGGRPAKEWGYSVQVSGASWERSFSVARRLGSGVEANAFTMDVLPVPEPYAFGGAPEGQEHTRVMDVLLPPGVSQKDALSGAGRVPFVYAAAAPAPLGLALQKPAAADAKPVPAAAAKNSIVDVNGDLVSITGPVEGIRKLQFGRVVSKDGAQLGRVMVMQVNDSGLLAQLIDGKAPRGAHVAFDAPKPSP